MVPVSHPVGSIVAQAFAEYHPVLFRKLAGSVWFNAAAEVPEFRSLPGYFLSASHAHLVGYVEARWMSSPLAGMPYRNHDSAR
ncbi:hypothetical protein ACQPXH_20125 [Nocardia sp. CA-135953]|uniref:hypothetical protein n=1 Tax=Nocardia sp. CA-135953 TaxID=3239978 RepID=UPI003D98D2C8